MIQSAAFNIPPRPAVVRLPLLRWTYGLINRLVMTGDVAIIILSSIFLLLPRSGEVQQVAWSQAALLGVLEAMVFVYVLNRLGTYRVENYKRPLMPLLLLVPGLLCAWLVGSAYFFEFRGADAQPIGGLVTDLFWYWHAPQVVALVAARLVERALAHVYGYRLTRRNVAIVGTSEAGASVIARMTSPEQCNDFQIVGVFAAPSDERQYGEVAGQQIKGDLEALGDYALAHVIDLVVVALPLPGAIETVTASEPLKWMGSDVAIPLQNTGIPPGFFARLVPIAGLPMLQVLSRPLKGSQALVKIMEDYVLASILLLLISPLMLLIAVAIKLDSEGPVFFLQERAGFNNNTFLIYKFRTMTVDPRDDGSVGTKGRNDPRITRVGGLLRRLSLDEVPQLINVILGDMSLVGPRPYVPNMLVGSERFRTAVRNYAFRYRLKPGITGLAQASGLRSAALRSLANAERSVELDLQYISRWSIWLDFRIMVQTLLVAMTGPDVF
jgi:putative colanic acid biosynthesis UDP-glucose lipid carrier transferase